MVHQVRLMREAQPIHYEINGKDMPMRGREVTNKGPHFGGMKTKGLLIAHVGHESPLAG